MSSRRQSQAMSKAISRRSSMKSCVQTSYDSLTEHSIYRQDRNMLADSMMVKTSVAGC